MNEHAVKVGTRARLVSVALAGGDVCQALGRVDQALDAYRRGCAPVDAQSQGEQPVGAGERVALWLGIASCLDEDQEAVLKALQWMPEALQQDPDAWWCLPRLLPRLSRIHHDAWMAETVREPLAKALDAAAQRRDCTEALESLKFNLPAELYQAQVEL